MTDLSIAEEEWIELRPAGPEILTPPTWGTKFRVKLRRNSILVAPEGAASGQRILWLIEQDETGSRTLTADAGWGFGGALSSFGIDSTALSISLVEGVFDDVTQTWRSTQFIPSGVFDPAGTATAAIAASAYIAKAQGVVALVAGEATVADTGVTAGSRFILSRQLLGSAPGHLSVDTRSNGVSFHIQSSDAGDDGTVFWQRFQP